MSLERKNEFCPRALVSLRCPGPVEAAKARPFDTLKNRSPILPEYSSSEGKRFSLSVLVCSPRILPTMDERMFAQFRDILR